MAPVNGVPVYSGEPQQADYLHETNSSSWPGASCDGVASLKGNSLQTVVCWWGKPAVEGLRKGRKGREDEAGMRAKVQGWVHDSSIPTFYFDRRGKHTSLLTPKPFLS